MAQVLVINDMTAQHCLPQRRQHMIHPDLLVWRPRSLVVCTLLDH